MIALFSLWCACSSAARTWTDVQGRKIEGELVRVDGEKAIVQIQGKEVPISISLLSASDQKFLEEWKIKDASIGGAAQVHSLRGTMLKADGKINVVRVRLRNGELKRSKLFSDEDPELLIGVALPPGFNPKRPQNVLWVGINSQLTYKNNVTRVEGESAVFLEKAIEAGFVVVAADCLKEGKDHDWTDVIMNSINQEATDILKDEWPGFQSWRVVCAGKSAPDNCAYLVRNKVNAVGVIIFDASSAPITWDPRRSNLKESEFKNLKVFVSFVKLNQIVGTDPQVNIDKEKQTEQSWKAFYGDVRIVYQSSWARDKVNQDEFKAGLQWFLQK